MNKIIATVILIAITLVAGLILYSQFNTFITTFSPTSGVMVDIQASMVQDDMLTALLLNVKNVGGKPIRDITVRFNDADGRVYTWRPFSVVYESPPLESGQSTSNFLKITKMKISSTGNITFTGDEQFSGVSILPSDGHHVYLIKWSKPVFPFINITHYIIQCTVPNLKVSASWAWPEINGFPVYAFERGSNVYLLVVVPGEFDAVRLYDLNRCQIIAEFTSPYYNADVSPFSVCFVDNAVCFVLVPTFPEESNSSIIMKMGLDGSVQYNIIDSPPVPPAPTPVMIYTNGYFLLSIWPRMYIINATSLQVTATYDIGVPIRFYIRKNGYLVSDSPMGLWWPFAEQSEITDIWCAFPSTMWYDRWYGGDPGIPEPIDVSGRVVGWEIWSLSGKGFYPQCIVNVNVGEVAPETVFFQGQYPEIGYFIPPVCHDVVFVDPPKKAPGISAGQCIFNTGILIGEAIEENGTISIVYTYYDASFIPIGFYKGMSYSITVTATATDGSQYTKTITVTVG